MHKALGSLSMSLYLNKNKNRVTVAWRSFYSTDQGARESSYCGLGPLHVFSNISLTPTESWAISQVPPSSSANLVQAVEVHSRKCPLKERGFNLTRLTSYNVEHTLEEKKIIST